MIGFMNKCPHCIGKSSFTPEEMECDKSLVLWCNICGEYINQTMTLETLRRWWARFDDGEEAILPIIGKDDLKQLEAIEKAMNERIGSRSLDDIELHIKDFRDYHYTAKEKAGNNEGKIDGKHVS